MIRQSRREFLENSLLAAAAAMAGTSAASSPAHAQGSSSPNERLRVAVLGVNGRGGAHVSAFSSRNDTQVAVICDPDENVGGKRAEALGNAKGYKVQYVQDLRRVMDDQSIDIVSIATPNHWHALATIWAVQAGKDVYVEKPISHNVSEGRRMVQAAQKHGRIVQTGTQARSHQAQRELVEFVKSGGIGEVLLARGLCYKRRGSIGPRGNYDVPAGVDYNVWLGPAAEQPVTRPKFHYDWHWQWDFGNGDLGNQGVHQMDIARWGLGVTGLGRSVLSYGGRLGYEDAGETANTQVNIHDFGNKQLVFEVRGLPTEPLRGASVGVIFYGTEGYGVSTSNYAKAAVFDNDGKLIQEFSGGGENLHYANFIDAVRSRKAEQLNAPLLEGHFSAALCHLGNISYRLGQMIGLKEAEERLGGQGEAVRTFGRFAEHLTQNGVDLAQTKLRFGRRLELQADAEQFTGEDVALANQMLTREYRAPFVVPDEKNV